MSAPRSTLLAVDDTPIVSSRDRDLSVKLRLLLGRTDRQRDTPDRLLYVNH